MKPYSTIALAVLLFVAPLRAQQTPRNKDMAPHSGTVRALTPADWYVVDDDGTTYEWPVNTIIVHENAKGFYDGDKLQYWTEKEWGTRYCLHVTNFKKQDGKEIKLIVYLVPKKSEKHS
jgi:hypothetical protein